MQVSVIIAARNAAATIGKAVRSALAQPETRDVIVIDDGSTDDTASASRDSDDGSGRLTVEVLRRNIGPSAARNIALGLASGSHVAILDSDDYLTPGRFAHFPDERDWEICADNIMFVERGPSSDTVPVPARPPSSRDVTLKQFVDSNSARLARGRTQLGFLKPVIKKDFLEKHAIRYRESVRLGEDFLLIVECMARSARFKLIGSVGYVAIESPASLSATHRTEDLFELYKHENQLLHDLALSGTDRRALAKRVALTRRKYALRHALDQKRAHGLGGMCAMLARTPSDIPGVVEGILYDKLGTRLGLGAKPRATANGRLLFDPR